MENQSEIIEKLGNPLIGFLEKFLNLFLVEGVSIATQQVIKVSILFIALLFIVLFLGIVFRFLKISIASMKGHSDYIFFITMTILVFSFAGDFSFGGVCVAIFFFLLLGHIFKLISKNKPKIVEALTRTDILETIKNFPTIIVKEGVKE